MVVSSLLCFLVCLLLCTLSKRLHLDLSVALEMVCAELLVGAGGVASKTKAMSANFIFLSAMSVHAMIKVHARRDMPECVYAHFIRGPRRCARATLLCNADLLAICAERCSSRYAHSAKKVALTGAPSPPLCSFCCRENRFYLECRVRPVFA